MQRHDLFCIFVAIIEALYEKDCNGYCVRGYNNAADLLQGKGSPCGNGNDKRQH